MVIGGETGSNAGPQPNMEILPKPAGGDTVIFLEWLNRTNPNNLYPFVIILPSTHVFVGERSSSHFWACWLIKDVAYYNEARILDPVTFDTILQLPNIPGAVNDCKRPICGRWNLPHLCYSPRWPYISSGGQVSFV